MPNRKTEQATKPFVRVYEIGQVAWPPGVCELTSHAAMIADVADALHRDQSDDADTLEDIVKSLREESLRLFYVLRRC